MDIYRWLVEEWENGNLIPHIEDSIQSGEFEMAELNINDIVTVDLYGERLGKVVSLHDPGDEYGLSVEVELDTPWRGAKRLWFERKEVIKEGPDR